MTVKELINSIDKVEKIANLSKVGRLLYNPFKYTYAVFYRKFVYPKNRQEKIIDTQLFYSKNMRIALPASTDIYLTGGKSHSSEIRLAKFLIQNLSEGDQFMDIGAHYGYFTLLGAEIVGKSGTVFAFEPSNNSFEILSHNASGLSNVKIFKQAISSAEGTLEFFEFSNLHAEYNSIDITQFSEEEWFKVAPPKKISVQASTIDNITNAYQFSPKIIKIDVEGAEHHVINGGISYLQSHAPILVMEYLEPNRNNEPHKLAYERLINLGYTSKIITADGSLSPVNDIDAYLKKNNLESDNIAFVKI